MNDINEIKKLMETVTVTETVTEKGSSELQFLNTDKRKSIKTQLADLRHAFSHLQRKYERDTYDLRTRLQQEIAKNKSTGQKD